MTEETTLPGEHDGVAIDWEPWREVPIILAHVDNACRSCGHPGPPLLAHGYAPLLRYQAHRCPACQETRVWERVRDWRGLDLVEIAYSPPRTVVRADG